MKPPNPFALWEEKPKGAIVRKEEGTLFKGFLGAVNGRQGPLLVVEGAPGTGKSFLLRRYLADASKEGVRGILVKTERLESEEDISEKLFFEAGGGLGTGGRVPKGLGALIDSIYEEGKGFGLMIIIDDLERARRWEMLARRISREAGKAAGKRALGFVIGTAKGWDDEGAMRIHLGPLDEHEAREMVERSLKDTPHKMGEECFQTILAESGGNPRLFKTICWHIYERIRENEKIISKGHYLAYLPAVMSMLGREWFGRLYQKTPGAQRAILETLAREPDGMHVSDVARKLGKGLGPTTSLSGRLLEAGLIIRLDRGRYRIFSRLFCRYVLQRSGS